MYSRIKTCLATLSIFFCLNLSHEALAQNKVVVVPLGGDVSTSQFNELVIQLDSLAVRLEALESAPAAPTAWGSFRGNGSIRAKSQNIVEILHPSVGKYCVVFNEGISGARLESSVITGGGSGPAIGDINNGIGGLDGCSTNTSGFSGLQVTIYDENGALSNERWSVIVP